MFDHEMYMPDSISMKETLHKDKSHPDRSRTKTRRNKKSALATKLHARGYSYKEAARHMGLSDTAWFLANR